MQILVIDHEPQMRRLLEISLHASGYDVVLAESARAGLLAVAQHQPSLILLELALPDEDGHSVLSALHEWWTGPIIIVSSLDNESDIVRALENGARDYIVKPFKTAELLARIKSALRTAEASAPAPIIKMNGFEIDFQSKSIKKNNEPVPLTVTQYALMALFVKNEGRALTHQYILGQVWGPESAHQLQYLRVFIAQLRKKIEQDPNDPKHLITISGVGYRFVAAPAAMN